jgi:hypothetical protein|tara:strand:+ start:14074 stop:15399 length:1326 start_codon:yes stop_codon:yes gene_type:complete
MSIRKFVQQVRPREQSYKPKLIIVEELLAEEELPKDIMRGLSYEKSEKQSTSKRDVYIVRSSDRETDRDEILRNLNQAGIKASLGTSSSSVDPIDGIYQNRNFRIFVKPLSGGMGETTLNSSITELFPLIAFEKKYNPKDIISFHQFLLGVDVSKLKCVGPKDIKAAEETINKADTSTKFKEKMANAIGVLKYIQQEDKNKKIKSLFWGYRAKPAGVPSKHPGDMFITYNDNKILGVSLKAGGKKTSEPQLNTYIGKVFDEFKDRNYGKLMSLAYKSVYSKIPGMPPERSFIRDRKTKDILRDFDKKNNAQYEKFYNDYLEIMRQGIVKLFNKNKDNTIKYIKTNILRDAPDVPTIVIKAVGSDYEEVTDKDQLGVFLPQVKFIKATSSQSSKQNWFIELTSGPDTLKMSMSIRTNKSGHAGLKKLGQFSLAVKYNGLSKK